MRYITTFIIFIIFNTFFVMAGGQIIFRDVEYQNVGVNNNIFDSNLFQYPHSTIISPMERFDHKQQIPDFETLRQNGLLERDGHLYLYLLQVQLWDNISWVNGVQWIYTYDSDGNQLSERRQDWDGNYWVNTNQDLYTYDSDGNQLSWVKKNWDENNWVNDRQWIYTYDSDGNQLRYLRQNWVGNDWVNSHQYFYTYDSDGNRLSCLDQNSSGNNWVNDCQYLYTYDSNGNQLSDLRQNWEDNNWVNSYQYLYTYDSNGNQLSDLRQDWEDNNWAENDQSLYTYDSDGNQLSRLYQNWEDNNWVNSHQNLYTYDSDGNQLSDLRQNSSGNNWVNSHQSLYTYDSDGNQLSERRQEWVGNYWANSYQYLYTYDSNGNQLSYLGQTSSGYNWVNSHQYLYTYDSDGNQLSRLYQNWDENNWVIISQNLYIYVTDSPMFINVQNHTINEGDSLTIQLEAGSPIFDPSGYSFSVFNDHNDVSVTNDSNLVMINPTENWNGSTEITAILFDDNIPSDTTVFQVTVIPVNDSPEPFNVLYPTVTDTFSSHIDSNIDIGFNWENCNDVENDVTYKLTIELEFFGNTYTDIYNDIFDTTISIPTNNLDPLLGGLNIEETILTWFVEAYDDEYSVTSDSGQFILIRSLLSVNETLDIPKDFVLHHNYPNPFNPTTTIRYDLPKDSKVQIMIYDIMGRVVRILVNEKQNGGYKSIIWNGTNDFGQEVGMGMYFYRISAGGFVQIKKMVLLK